MKELLGLGVLAWPLVLLVAILLGFVIAIVFGVAYAKRHGKRSWLWAMLGFLVVFLPIFWDWIPTVVAHKYYCATEAGFWIYKTPEQWKKENPGVMETLEENKARPRASQGDMQNFTDTAPLNQRIDSTLKKNGPLPLNRWKWEQEVIDTKTGEVLARYADFSTGNGNIGGEMELRFWLHSDGCFGYSAVNDANFIAYEHQFLGVKK